MKPISELTKGIGPTRKRELTAAHKAAEVATGQLAELQQTLAKQKADQAALAPSTLVTAGANVATLAQGLQLQSAHSAVITHLEQEAIPQATRAVQRASKALTELREAITRAQRHIATQQALIAKAQAEVDNAAGWLDT